MSESCSCVKPQIGFNADARMLECFACGKPYKLVEKPKPEPKLETQSIYHGPPTPQPPQAIVVSDDADIERRVNIFRSKLVREKQRKQAPRAFSGKKNWAIIGLLCLLFLIIGLTSPFHALVSTQKQVSSSAVGATLDLKIYDVTMTQVSNIGWGIVAPGDKATWQGYLQNTGNIPQNVSLSTSNWVPASVANLVSVSWKQQYQVIPPNGTIQIQITLAVPASATQIPDFNFNLQILGVQQTQ